MGETSDFGRGVIYPLGLFLAHAGELKYTRVLTTEPYRPTQIASLWFYGAADHLMECEVDCAPTLIRSRVRCLVDFVMKRRLPEPDQSVTWEDAEWAIAETKAILLEIDRVILLVPCCQAIWA